MISLIDPDCKILIAEPSTSARHAMSSVLRALGYTTVVACETLEEVYQILAKETYHWLITSLFLGGKSVALHLLLADSEAPTGLRITLCASGSEHLFVSRGFSLGLFSYLPKPFNRDQFKTYVETLRADVEANGDNPSILAAAALRPLLRSQYRYDELLSLETHLIAAFPNETRLLLNLAEVLFERGEAPRAQSLLWQALEREPKLKDEINRLCEPYVGDASGSGWPQEGNQVAVVIDSDGAGLKLGEKALKAAGAPEVQTFSDGEACWDWIEVKGAPAIILMEWRLAKLSGPALLQRLRSAGMHQTPVIVVSSLVKKTDLAILGEMGVLSIIEKPTRQEDLVNCIAWALRQNQRPTEEPSMEARISSLLAAGNIPEARGMMELFAAKAPDESAKLRYFEASFAFHDQEFAKARDLAKASINLGNRSVSAFNLLGKALMQLREFSAAIQIFEKANQIAPGSIERLCAIAEGHAELGATDAALAQSKTALGLDAGSATAIKTGMNVALVTGNAELMAELSEGAPPSQQVLAFLNNKAVATARTGKFDESIALYQNALQALPAGREDLRGIILYNLALAQIQNGSPKKALESLTSIKALDGEQQRQKVASLMERTREAVKTGRAPKLNLVAQLPEEIDAKACAPAGTVITSTHDQALSAKPYFLKGIFFEEKTDSVLVDSIMSATPTINLLKIS